MREQTFDPLAGLDPTEADTVAELASAYLYLDASAGARWIDRGIDQSRAILFDPTVTAWDLPGDPIPETVETGDDLEKFLNTDTLIPIFPAT